MTKIVPLIWLRFSWNRRKRNVRKYASSTSLARVRIERLKKISKSTCEALDPVSLAFQTVALIRGAPISTFSRRNLRHTRNSTDFLVQLLAAARNEVSWNTLLIALIAIGAWGTLADPSHRVSPVYWMKRRNSFVPLSLFPGLPSHDSPALCRLVLTIPMPRGLGINVKFIFTARWKFARIRSRRNFGELSRRPFGNE